MKAQVVCLGETMAQVVPLEGGGLADARRFAMHAAGAESNVARALVQLGTRAAWQSRVGDDPIGTRVLNEIAAAGVDVTLVTRSRERTGLFLKDPGATGSSVHYYRDRSAATTLCEADVDAALGTQPKVLHLTGVTPALSESCRRAVLHATAAARDSGVLLSFDVNYRKAVWARSPGRDAAAELLNLARTCGIVFVGLDEAADLWGTRSPDEVRDLVGDAPQLVVKDGARAAVGYDRETRVIVPALKVDVVEPVGAGDAFAGGWLHGLLQGFTPQARLRLGHLTAAAALTTLSDHFDLGDGAATLLRAATAPHWAPTDGKPA